MDHDHIGSVRTGWAADAARDPAVRLASVSKTYQAALPVHALRDVSVDVLTGSFTAVMGPSGSGKSTLLHCAAGLDRPTAGQVWLGDTEVSALNERRRTELRRKRTGFVFQAFNLLPALTAAQNVALPMLLAGEQVDVAVINAVLEQVGLTDQRSRRPGELSGGQQQRVAIARALVTRPDVLFADEPTGALDLRSGRDTLRLFRTVVSDLGQTVIMVTHDPTAASYADGVLFLADGQLVGELRGASAEQIGAALTQLTDPEDRPC